MFQVNSRKASARFILTSNEPTGDLVSNESEDSRFTTPVSGEPRKPSDGLQDLRLPSKKECRTPESALAFEESIGPVTEKMKLGEPPMQTALSPNDGIRLCLGLEASVRFRPWGSSSEVLRARDADTVKRLLRDTRAGEPFVVKNDPEEAKRALFECRKGSKAGDSFSDAF